MELHYPWRGGENGAHILSPATSAPMNEFHVTHENIYLIVYGILESRGILRSDSSSSTDYPLN